MNELNADITLALAPFLTANDLISLASTCRHFGGSPSTARRNEQFPWNEPPRHMRARLMQERNDGVLSLIEEAAMNEVETARGEDIDWDRGGLLKRAGSESWFAPYNRLVQLRTKPVFYRIVGKRMTHHSSTDLSLVRSKSPMDGLMTNCWEMPLALCQDVMTEGVHYAEFKAVRGGEVKIGIVRPAKEWDCKKMKIGLLDDRSGFIHYCVQQQSLGIQGYDGDVHHFLYKPDLRDNDVIGVGLDLDAGELSVYLNDVEIGVKKRGLRGHYCWAVSIRDRHPIIKISRPPWAKVIEF